MQKRGEEAHPGGCKFAPALRTLDASDQARDLAQKGLEFLAGQLVVLCRGIGGGVRWGIGEGYPEFLWNVFSQTMAVGLKPVALPEGAGFYFYCCGLRHGSFC